MLVDRDRLVCHGLRTLLHAHPTSRIVTQVNTGGEALALLESEHPELILLELDLGAENGLDVMQALLKVKNTAPVLVMTHVRDAEEHRKAMVLGASGVIQKEADLDVLMKAIEKVHAGEIWYDRSKMGGVLRDIVRNENQRKENPVAISVASLTPRELEVTVLVSKGLKNREIGNRLYISETTVRHHLTSVFEKLGVSNRQELIIFTFRQGLASIPDNDQAQYNGREDSNEVVEVISRMRN
jgi:DNA-binding NarL/FixJ family response regulator